MKVTLTVQNKNLEYPLILFGARNNLMKPNWGNNTFINISAIEFDKEYEEYIFLSNETPLPNNIYYDTFLMDLVKHDFVVVSVNGKLECKVYNGGKWTYKDINQFDPYSNIYMYRKV